MRLRHSVRSVRLAALGGIAVAAIACTSKSDQAAAGGTDSAAPAAATDTSRGATGDSGMAHMSDSAHMAGMGNMAMTGNPDQDFLRMMSDHHKGLIAMAHLSAEGEKKGSAGVQADARKLDTKQDAELDSMTTMLEKDFKDAYAPKVTPDNQAMVDQLKGLSGAAYDRAFYENTVKHHQQAVQMVDEFAPKLQRADLKAMAQRMRADQTREIAEFQRKAAAAGK